ncbi:hypothetical protein C5167_007970 [Papaver somniferum]|uniref:non-specific serine/threonine protein kinase n=1 Tax=Papaver somniferum TaxID=3469 RepID=A0A4Y7JT54_PAPSO|nr:hypothetical protein C5167_007970 [Papaver somniferum]
MVLPVPTNSISFNFPNFTSNDPRINLQGYSVRNGSFIEVTRNSGGSVGRAIYSEAIQLWDATTGRMTDFDTSFIINGHDETIAGDGMAFFLASFGSTLPPNSSGGGLGLLTRNISQNNLATNQIVAVEFDSFKNQYDPSSDHVGINVNSVVSVATVLLADGSISDGRKANAWVTYNSATERLSVFLSYGNNPVFSGSDSILFHIVDLSKVLPERITVGFSASNGRRTEIHRVLSWQFNSTPELIDEKTCEGRTDGKGKGIATELAVGLGVVLGVLGCGLGFAFFICWKKWRTSRKVTGDARNNADSSMDYAFQNGTGPKRGGFGGVYKGFLSDLNLNVAVKRVSQGSQQGKKEYQSEVKIISQLRHRNLVQLIGWCHVKNELLLVYEFMPKRSLDKHLFRGVNILTWETRYRIALGLAFALSYLHEDWEQCVLHRDIKTSNVMLDSEFNAKLGDFGLARLVDHAKGSKTTAVAGTRGYLAPECFKTRKSTKESDVYSFGIVALDIACGRRPVEATTGVSSVGWVWGLYGGGKLLDAADEKLNKKFNEVEMQQLMIVGLWCAHPDSKLRPLATQVIRVLKFESPLPKLPLELPNPVYRQAKVSAPCFSSLAVHACILPNTGLKQSPVMALYNTLLSNAHLHFSIFLFIGTILSVFPNTTAKPISFAFPSTPNKDNELIHLQGDSVLADNTIQLTINATTGSVGRATYSKRIKMWDATTKTVADFSTHFSFVVDTKNNTNSNHVDGIAFFLMPYPSEIPPDLGGGYLGLMSSNITQSDQQIVVVEFDTYQNSWDTSPDHVGININNSIMSVASESLYTNSMKNGAIANASISYNSTTKILDVTLTYNHSTGTISASLHHNVDLRTVLPENIRVGFSAASTGTVFSCQKILSWEFRSNIQKRSRVLSSELIVGLIVGLDVFGCLIGFTIFIWWRRKRRLARKSDLDAANSDGAMDDAFEEGAGPKRFLYSELVYATNNFHEAGKLGEGGFGGVYRGFLSGIGLDIAVKRISKGSQQGKREYQSEVRIISQLRHRNLVQLLDYNAKLGDFGLARLVDHQLGSQTTVLAGTMGYLAPECIYTSKSSKESDVYSFGIVALEIACGRKPVEQNKENLVDCVWELYANGKIVEAADGRLNMDFDMQQMERLLVLGLWCAHPDPTTRPTIRQVKNLLNYESSLVNLPTKLPSPVYDYAPRLQMCKLAFASSCGDYSHSQTNGSQCRCSSCSNAVSLGKVAVWDYYGRGDLLDAADKKLKREFNELEMEQLMVLGLWCASPEPKSRPLATQVINFLKFESPSPKPLLELPPPPVYCRAAANVPNYHSSSADLTDTFTGR